jgi:hypothetical protein
MKYLITESQLDNVIYIYLDNLNLYRVEDRGDYYFWSSKESWKRSEYVVISATRKRKDCFVGSDLLSEISSFFSLDLESALSIISKWVETKVDFEITYPYSDYGAD